MLRGDATTFQVSKCSACKHTLELPSVHFMCQHSYHQHCFQSYSESEKECPACHAENKRIVDIIKSQRQSRDHHDAFHSQLEKADDGFAVVADYFGRGVFRSQSAANSKQPLTSSQQQSQIIGAGGDHITGPPPPSGKRPRDSGDGVGQHHQQHNVPPPQPSRPPPHHAATVDSITEGMKTKMHLSQHSTAAPSSGNSRASTNTQVPPNRHGTMPVTRESLNPFGDNLSDSPAPSSNTTTLAVSSNPFGEPTDANSQDVDNYDEALNPFA